MVERFLGLVYRDLAADYRPEGGAATSGRGSVRPDRLGGLLPLLGLVVAGSDHQEPSRPASGDRPAPFDLRSVLSHLAVVVHAVISGKAVGIELQERDGPSRPPTLQRGAEDSASRLTLRSG